MIAIVTFIFGLILGSFLSVVFTRLEIDEPGTGRRRKRRSRRVAKEILFGRSRCDHCRRQLPWYDNVPLLSFLLLRGRCRHCGKSISGYHPVLELATALMLTAAVLFYGLTWQFVLAGLFGSFMLLIFAYDLRHQIIPNVVVVPAILLALVVLVYQFVLFRSGDPLQLTPWSADPQSYLLGGALVGLFFLAMSVLSRGRWIGGGDIKLAVLIGLLLGWPYAVVAVVLAYFVGTAYAIALLATRQATLKTAVPFGPMLAIGYFVAAYYGDVLVTWYDRLVL